MTSDSALQSKLTRILTLCGVGALIAVITTHYPLSLGAVGTVDFVQYWSAWQVMLDGGNSYNPQEIYAVQASLTSTPFPLMFSWNPPWTYTLLSPLLGLPFQESATLWLLVQVLFLCLIASIVPLTFSLPQLHPLKGALAVTFFFPVLNSMYWGQLGILMAASIASFLFYERKGRLFWAGVTLLPLTMKPHLFFLFIPPAIKWIGQIPRRDQSRFLLGAIGGFVILVVLTLAIAPGSIASWFASFSASSTAATTTHTIHFQDWQTATLATWVRIGIQHFTTYLPTWPLSLFPLTGTLASAVYFFRNSDAVIWSEVAPPLLCLSLLMSNYGWTFDQSVLLVGHVVVISRAYQYSSRGARYAMIIAAFSVQFLALLLSRWADAPQHYFVWMPVAMLCLLIADQQIRKRVGVYDTPCAT